MTTPIHVPERVQQLAAALHRDRTELTDVAKGREEALAMATEADKEVADLRRRLAEAEALAVSSRQEADRLSGREGALLREIGAAEEMLAVVVERHGYQLPALLPPSVTPSQGLPIVQPVPVVPVDADATQVIPAQDGGEDR